MPVAALAAWLRRPVPFALGWRNMLALGFGLGAMSVAISIFLEPFGTGGYDPPWRNLRLSGYALCFVLPFALFHAIDRQTYRWQGRRWYLYNELITRSLLTLAVTSATWLYNIRVINDLPPTLDNWWYYLVHVSLPYTAILLPLAVLAASLVAWRWPEAPPGTLKVLILKGRNRGETISLQPDQFLYAEAQQNYVQVHYWRDGKLHSQLLRAPLGDMEAQLPGSVRIHRSYLINPEQLERIEGNARKRLVRMRGLDQVLPASPDFDPALLR